VISDSRADIRAAFTSGRVAYLLPMAFCCSLSWLGLPKSSSSAGFSRAGWPPGVLYATVIGTVLGVVYARSRHNLLAPVLAHTLIMAPLVMTSLHFSVGAGPG
jgi:membrane protease YdiL (CAAX protease family)